jgi:putative aldouronate transport system substrate-binding protein
MKKLVSVFSLLLLTFVLLAMTACNRGDEAGVDRAVGTRVELSPNNPVTIPTLLVTNQMAPSADNKISQLLRDTLGVTITYEIVPLAEQSTRIATALAGGHLPDLVGVTQQEGDLVYGGGLLRLDPFLDSGQWPNLAAHIEPYRTRLTWTGGGVPDGIYQFPNYNRFYSWTPEQPILGPVHWGSGFFIQKSVLEYHGFPSLSNMTLERYFQLIYDYMRSNPTIEGMPTIGFTFPTQGRTWGMTNPPLFLAGHPNNGGVFVLDGHSSATVRAEIYAISDYARRYFEILNYWYLRGLVDPEAWTQTEDEYMAKLATGRVLGMHDQRWGFGNAYDALVSEGRYNRTWVPTEPTMDGHSPWYADRDVMNINQGFGISASAQNPELILTFLDTILSPEWQIILSWGIQGEDFYVDAQGRFYRSDVQRANAVDLTWRQHNRLEAFFDVMPKMQGGFPCGNAFSAGDQPVEFLAGLSGYNRFFLESYNKGTWRQFVAAPPSNPVYYPAWQISPQPGTAAQVANQQLEDAAVEFLPRVITAPAGQFAARWQEYVDRVGMIDVAAFEAVITEGLRERLREAGY